MALGGKSKVQADGSQGFVRIAEEAFGLLTEWFGDDISALANAANSWRNELAHEKREYKPTVDVINAVRLIEHINYCIVFRHAGYSDEKIKSIIAEILVR